MTAKASESVQTIERAMELLEVIADNDAPVSVSALSSSSGLPLPTVHRLLQTLISLGYARQLPSRKYGLGSRLIQLGLSARGTFGSIAEPYLRGLVDSIGETANLAIFDEDRAVHLAQVPSRHSMRMVTEIGRRSLPHATGGGKAMLSQMSDQAVSEIMRRNGMPARTDRTLTNLTSLLGELERIRQQGWAEDNGEQAVGVRCFAVPIPGITLLAAISVSGPEVRLTRESAARVVPELQAAARDLAAAFNGSVGERPAGQDTAQQDAPPSGESPVEVVDARSR